MSVTTHTDNRQRFIPLRVADSGICCAVGYHAQAASCALRAGMDHFQESNFITSDGSPIRVARLDEDETWGPARLALWARYAIEECLEFVPAAQRAQIPTVLITAVPDHPRTPEQAAFETAQAAQEALETRFAPHSRLFQGGRADLAQGLIYASGLLTSKQATRVLVVGLDSLLNAATITNFLHQERLLVAGNSDGFIPGEGAAAVLLELAENTRAPGLYILGIGQGMEPGRPDGSVPSRARGLSHAIRQAMQHANCDTTALSFRVSDQNGESFFAREAANALTRVSTPGGNLPSVLTTADCTGEIGAATGPLMLAWLHHLLPHHDAPGECGLLHLANDTGERTAVIVRQQR